MAAGRRKHWGWGFEHEQPPHDEVRGTAAFLASHLGFGSTEPEAPVPLSELTLPPPRLAAPARLAGICATDDRERAFHAYGSSYRDVVRAFRGRFDHPPDVVAHPADEGEIEAVLEWALSANAAIIPFGGGTSVVGGVEPAVDPQRFDGVVTIDLGRLDRVLEVDALSLSARIQAGATGPCLEEQLRGHDLTLRHFPQSFQFATLGGMIATRAGGHFATVYTHIDDLVQSVRAITPAGVWESRRLPGSGAGISPDRMLIGSEGTLGVITEAWVRVRPRPRFRASAGVRFATFLRRCGGGARALPVGPVPRQLPAHRPRRGAADGNRSARTRQPRAAGARLRVRRGRGGGRAWTRRSTCCADHGGTWDEPRGASGDSVRTWRDAFLRAPYLRDTFVAMGVISETFETAVTWDRFAQLHQTVTERTTAAVHEVCGAGSVTCRFTHVYPDGPAPYYTVLAPGRRGEELEQWAAHQGRRRRRDPRRGRDDHPPPRGRARPPPVV